MEKLEIIISLAGAAVTFLATTVTFIIKFINAAKERNLKKMEEIAQEAVQYVEILKGKSNSELTGDVKKALALERIENKCVSGHIKFQYETADGMIEKLVNISKSVNPRDKDKYAEFLRIQS